MFDRFLPEETEFAEDAIRTLDSALRALHRLGHPILFVWQPRTLGGLHMRQTESLRELRDRLDAIKLDKKSKGRKKCA